MQQTEARSFSTGVNQKGVREHNERLILSMLQRFGATPGSDLARAAGLSPQTVSVILRGLEQDGLLERGDPQRGRVGKPSVPMGLAADGAFSVGLKIGRRSADLLLADFHGRVRQQMQKTYRYPMPETVFGFLEAGLKTFKEGLSTAQFDRIAGIGIAKPFEIWNWHETIGAPAADLEAWRGIDFAEEVARFTGLPVYLENDATAACRAEHVYGRGREFSDFAYFFIGSFIGGGIVLNHSVFEGVHGNAGAFGSIPVRAPSGGDCQLIDTGSLYLLEAEMMRAGIDPGRLWAQPQDWGGFPELLDDWIEKAAAQIARAALTVCAVIDVEAVLIDGGFPATVRARLVDRARTAVGAMDARGIIPPRIEGGVIGGNARALGAASGPVFAQFFLNTHAGRPAG